MQINRSTTNEILTIQHLLKFQRVSIIRVASIKIHGIPVYSSIFSSIFFKFKYRSKPKFQYIQVFFQVLVFGSIIPISNMEQLILFHPILHSQKNRHKEIRTFCLSFQRIKHPIVFSLPFLIGEKRFSESLRISEMVGGGDNC